MCIYEIFMNAHVITKVTYIDDVDDVANRINATMHSAAEYIGSTIEHESVY